MTEPIMNFFSLRISELPLSTEFKKKCSDNNIVLLGELLVLPVEELLQITWLTMPMLEELQEYIRANSIRLPSGAPGVDGDGELRR